MINTDPIICGRDCIRCESNGGCIIQGEIIRLKLKRAETKDSKKIQTINEILDIWTHYDTAKNLNKKGGK